MNFFSSFSVMYGTGLAIQAVMSGFLFRSSAAPMWMKLALPMSTVALVSLAPMTVNSMMGFPVTTEMRGLPDRAQLLTFVPNDSNETVDLWLRADGGIPRAYRIPLTAQMKTVLNDAAERETQGKLSFLVKKLRKGGAHSFSGQNSEGDAPDVDVTLDSSVITELPRKE